MISHFMACHSPYSSVLAYGLQCCPSIRKRGFRASRHRPSAGASDADAVALSRSAWSTVSSARWVCDHLYRLPPLARMARGLPPHESDDSSCNDCGPLLLLHLPWHGNRDRSLCGSDLRGHANSRRTHSLDGSAV